jgi:hypothetical protein
MSTPDTMIRATAIKALSFLLEGATLDAVRFRGEGFTLLFTSLRVDAGETYLHLDADWQIAAPASAATTTPVLVASAMTPPQQLVALYGLHTTAIRLVMLGAPRPDLAITFEDGREFVLSGHHEHYECWELGTALTEPHEDFCIIALPNDRLMVSTPEGFE